MEYKSIEDLKKNYKKAPRTGNIEPTLEYFKQTLSKKK